MNGFQVIKKALVIGCFFSSLAFASSISVQPLTLNFKGLKNYKDVMVYNTGKSNAYVNVTTSKAVDYGTKKEHWLKFSGIPEKFGLIVSQNKLVIPPGQVRYVRVLKVGIPLKHQAVYRLNFSPAQGKLEQVHVKGSNVLAGVRVVVSYNVIAKVAAA